MNAQKIEAIRRMKMLGLHKNAIREFKEESKLNYSENCLLMIGSIRKRVNPIYWIQDHELLEKIEKFEKETGALVYHVLKSNVMKQEHYSFLYVCENSEEWVNDRADIEENYIFVWVENMTYEDFSEYGTIKIEKTSCGINRVG